MSGGHFDYRQSACSEIADEIDRLLATHGIYPPDIVEKFEYASYALRLAGKMAQRIDWFVSGDDGEDSFRERWAEEVKATMYPASRHGKSTSDPAGCTGAQRDNDQVNHPSHYNDHPSGIECITVVEHMNFCLGNAMKYIWRAGLKDDTLQDLKKARWYLDREIQLREKTLAKMCAETKAGPKGPS